MKILLPIIVSIVAVTTASALPFGDYEYVINAYNTNTVTITSYTGAGGIVVIPPTITNKTVTSLGASSFSGSALTEVIIPENVSYIEYLAFSSCSSLTNVIIPASTSDIGTDVFSGCSSLTEIIVNTSNSAYSSLAGVLFNKSQSELIQYPVGKTSKSYTIPNSVTRIKERAFSSCTNLTSVTISDSVTRIEDHAFSGCRNLTNVAIPDSVTNIEAFAFSSCTSLTYVAIPDTVSSIGWYAFNSCTSLEGIYFYGHYPNTVYPSFQETTMLYYLPDSPGWEESHWRYTKTLWNPSIQTSDVNFGAQTNGFGFYIEGATNSLVKIEACTNLVEGVWNPIITRQLTEGSVYFSDPSWTNYPFRIYRLSMP